MDTDSNDGTAGESLNGETKPDPAKLAQTAIIKQDVMLSGTSTQSPLAPVSSVFTMPSVTMPSVSNSASLGLSDHLFMSVPSVADTATATAAHDKSDTNGTLSGLASPSHLLGQPQVAPQFFIASQPPGLANSASAAASSAIGVQQLLIPVSTGLSPASSQEEKETSFPLDLISSTPPSPEWPCNGTQQFISIPVSMATGGNQQIQLLTTSNGQIIATNLASLQALAQPLNLNLGGSAGGAASHGSHGNSSSSSHSSASSHGGGNHGLGGQIAIPQLLTTGAQGQLLAVTPQMMSSVSQLKSVASHRQVLSPVSITQANSSSSSSSSVNQQATGGSSAAPSVVSSSLQQAIIGAAHTPVIAHASAPHTPAISTAQVASNGLPPSVSQLLPNTVGNCTESTTVDGINLDEIKEFARQFKIRRLSLGLTQTQVGQALSATEGPAYSQSAICRFEKLDITPKSAQKIKPVLERWMAEAEERYKNGVQNLTEFIGSEPSKKRKRRTSFTPQALEVLNQYFERNTHPSGAEMTELSEKLSYDREVIRVWFCNKRQALKNTIKKLKQEAP